MVLNLPESAVRALLDSQGMLPRSGLLALERGGTEALRTKLNLLSDGLADRISSSDADPMELLRDVVLPSSLGHLSIEDFVHLNPQLDLLRTYLRRTVAESRCGVNVLLYGPPGTGKNQLVKTLAAEFGCDLYEVSSEDSSGDPIGGAMRLRAFRAAQAALSRSRALLLFDEVQDVVESADRGVF